MPSRRPSRGRPAPASGLRSWPPGRALAPGHAAYCAPSEPAAPRRRWLSVKVGWLLLAGAVFGGAVAGIVTWWYAPVNALHQGQFLPGYFDIQGIVPIGYAVFAVALGIAAGTLIGRSLPALAVTAGVFFALRLVITYWVRERYIPAVTTIYSVTQNLP